MVGWSGWDGEGRSPHVDAMNPKSTRRTFLRLAAGLPLVAALGGSASASRAPMIGRLIERSRVHPRISDRVDFISHALKGRPYRANTLIGGPTVTERFVVRDDAFDCVTFCEVVLAAANARTFAEFEAALMRIRYEHDKVRFDERNHYFAEWRRRAIEKELCRPVEIEPDALIEKTVNFRHFGERRISIGALSRQAFVSNRDKLEAGDIVGFVSRRPQLDFYHTGFVAFGRNGEWLLRHASQSKGRILDERMEVFLAANRVQHVALLRPSEPTATAGRG
jgi:hypothetical protein